ncbi:MAG: fibronectin type III domain-containing protein [Acidobacteriota bacterium]|nr:fibronectin type III domain-containing protein [Acidobacteriota bacterium]
MALALLAVWPAAALAGTLTTQPATNVGISSATLHGTGTGFASGNYCSFAYSSAGGSAPMIIIDQPAQPCNGSYSIKADGLMAGTYYTFFANQCTLLTMSGGQTYCAYNSGSTTTDPCSGNHASTCPTFTTGVPTGTTDAASAVLGSSATLNGTLHIEDLTTAQSGHASDVVQYHFEYSTDPNLAAYTSTPTQSLPTANTSSDPAVSAQVTNLVPGTTYYYRVAVSAPEVGATTESDGNIASFKTGGFVRTDPATSVTSSGAVINGEVDAGDLALSYSWLYSTSSATSSGLLSNSTTGIAGANVTAGGVQNVSATLTGLAAGTTYYFQLVTTNPAIHGQVVSFTTLPGYCGPSASALHDSAIPATGFLVTGCWSSAGGVYTGHGPVQINGVSFSGPASGTVQIDTNTGKISTSAPYDVDVGSVRMYSGTLSGRINKDYANSTSGGVTTSAFDLGATDNSATLYDLPLGGFARMTASSAGGATVGISALGLPSLFGGVTADGSVSVGQDGSVDQVHAQLGDSTIGPMTLPGFTLDGNPQTNTWTGDVNLMLPLAKAGISAQVEILNGKLNGLGANLSGADIPLGDSGLFLAGGGFSTVFSPLSLQGNLDVAFGPKLGGYDLLDIDAGFYAGFEQDQTLTGLPGIADGTVLHDVPFTLGINGTLNLLGFIQLESTSYRYYGVPGWPFVAMQSTLAQPLIASCSTYGIGFAPSLTLAGDARGTQFNLVGSGGAALDLCVFRISLSVTGAVSSTGMGICGSYLNNSVGAGITWPSSFSSLSDITKHFELYGSGCNIGNYETTISLARAAAAGRSALPVRLPRGLPFAVVRVRGRGAPPLLRIDEPAGRGAIVMSGLDGVTAARARYLVIPDAADDTTYVELTRPAGGHYAITPQPGSAPITGVSVAHGQPGPRVTATLRHHGSHEVLTWHALHLPGQRLTFRELGAGGDRQLASTTRDAGRILFRPHPGVPGTRSIVVDIYEHGMLNRIVHVARYIGPTITRPALPRLVTVTRRRRTLTIRWRRAGGTVDHYLVMVMTSDGRHRLFVARHPRLVLHAIPASGGVRVTVTGVDPLGRRGPSAQAHLTRHRKHHR